MIIYKDGELKNHIPNFDRLNYTKSFSKNAVIKVLMKLEIIPVAEIDSDEVIFSYFKELVNNLQNYTRGKLGYGSKYKNEDLSDSSEDDRGFSTTK